jgi:cobyrinic acid a,c-diamide synthase
MKYSFFQYNIPRVLISSHKGGAGKTLFTLGLISVLVKRGYRISPFKKGPDYIDAGWLGKIAGKECRNLDLFLFDEEHNLFSFYTGSKGSDVAIIEGNRGLFDGLDVYGSSSTARLAKILKSPVILVLDCTKVTRSLAALVKGFMEFEEDIEIKGVVLNKVARARHENIIRSSIEYYTGVKVLGSIPKLRGIPKERHLGLITSYEYDEKQFLDELRGVVEKNVDVEEIVKICKEVLPLEINLFENIEEKKYEGIKIGVFRDEAFQFYYPENLEGLMGFGAEIKYIDSLRDRGLPEVDGLYIGGGFPEVKAEALSENETLLKEVKEAVMEGMPLYAECGGLMYLGEEIIWKGKRYKMTGILPMSFEVNSRPQGHGYVIAKVEGENPYFEKGLIIKGHEFHYSRPVNLKNDKDLKFVFKLEKGYGLNGEWDGIFYRNLLASYTHIHIFSVKCWAEKFLKRAKMFKEQKLN